MTEGLRIRMGMLEKIIVEDNVIRRMVRLEKENARLKEECGKLKEKVQELERRSGQEVRLLDEEGTSSAEDQKMKGERNYGSTSEEGGTKSPRKGAPREQERRMKMMQDEERNGKEGDVQRGKK
eukprot:Pompholyxophrys_punicea_v1_NODE_284_length_2390_cov_13.907066.p3 type:complete len:124 gc:universal NODE_284_length_2390_cov_13.907066:2211-1840(-)